MSAETIMQRTPVEAPVVHVSVLEDRAQVKRAGRITLPEGLQRLKIEGVAPLIQDVSVRAVGRGAGRVVESRVRRRLINLTPEQPEAIKALDEALDGLEAGLKARRLEQDQRYARQLRLEATLSEALLEIPSDVAWGHSQPERWLEQIGDLFGRLDAVKRAQTEARFKDEDDRRDHRDALNKRRALGRPDNQLRADLEIDALIEAEGELELEVEYVVPNALWRPLHRARLEQEALDFTARAAVWQRTGEDWTDVGLSFSTARSADANEPPCLSDDLLTVQRKSNEVTLAAREVEIQAVTSREGAKNKSAKGAAPAPVAADLPGIDDGGEIRTITPEGRFTVPSDGRPCFITLSTFTAPARVRNVLMGELVEAALIEARSKNAGAAPLLPGPVELFTEQGAVGWSKLGFIAPDAPLEIGFGPVEGLRVVREAKSEAHKRHKDKWRVTTHEIMLYLSNLSDAPIEVEVIERIPVSELELVEIELVKDKTSGGPTPDENGLCAERWTLEPFAQLTLSFTWRMKVAPSVKQ